MRFLSVCSGIEAASVAWQPLGWQAVAFSEIEPFPCAVLAHHYPDTPNYGDMTKFKDWPDHAIDLLCGGTPCQSFSVAGLRKGLDDPRGNLMLTFGAIAARYRPKWLVWENVPGVLSSNGGRDFGSFLGLLGVLGYGFAYRIFDAQYAGLAQRRKRVFVVGCLGDWRSAAAVLFERHSMQGHPAPRRETGKAAPTIPSRSTAGGGLGTDFDCDGGLIEAFGGNNTAGPIDVATARNACASASGRMDFESETFLVSQQVAPSLTSNPYGDHESREGLLVAHSLRGEGFDASEDGTGRGTPLVPVAFAHQAGGTQTTLGYNPESQTTPTLAKSQTVAIAFDSQQITSAANRTRAEPGLPVSTIAKQSRMHVALPMAVRRLTPDECEKLQGFPPGYTAIPYRNKIAADGPRYKSLGNSWATPCAKWIGQRIEAVEAITAQQREAA